VEKIKLCTFKGAIMPRGLFVILSLISTAPSAKKIKALTADKFIFYHLVRSRPEALRASRQFKLLTIKQFLRSEMAPLGALTVPVSGPFVAVAKLFILIEVRRKLAGTIAADKTNRRVGGRNATQNHTSGGCPAAALITTVRSRK
jgi:hypothetical protein